MKIACGLFFPLFVISVATLASARGSAQPSKQAPSQPEVRSVTVPITLDHNRVVIDVDVPLADGSLERVRGWVDNGNPELEMSRRVAMLQGLNVSCSDKECSAPAPREIIIGGMHVSLAALKEVEIPLKPVSAASVMAAGMDSEINLPSTILRNYEVVIDFPGREFTMASPGTLKFKGVSSKIQINPQNGLIQVPSQMNNKKRNLGLDVGSSFSFLSREVGDELLSAKGGLPRMTGAVGPANMWGGDGELTWNLLRLERLQYGPAFLTGVAMAEFSKETMDWFAARSGTSTVGLLGSNALLNYRVGIDYAHSMVYFEVGSTFKAPDFDLIGLILRPEDDGRFTILGVADFEGGPSVTGVQSGDHLVAVESTPVSRSTMGQVWALLKGQPGQERVLTVERAGKELVVTGTVRHFLGEPPEAEPKEGKSRRKD